MDKREMDVARGGGNEAMPQKVLDDGKGRPIFQEVRGEGMAEAVGGDTLREPGPERGGAARFLKGGRA